MNKQLPNWNGEERRKMDQDWIQRDRLLTETHGTCRRISDWIEEHDQKDDRRFQRIVDDNKFRDKIIYGGLGIISFITFVWQFHK